MTTSTGKQRGPLVEDAVDDRRVAVGVDGDQPARSPDHQRARAHPARGEQVVGHAVRLHRGLFPSRHDDRPGAGGVVHGSRRHPHRPGHDLCRVVGRRRRHRRWLSSLAGFICPALPDGADRVRQLHRGNQGDRGPVSRREPLDRRRRLQRGRAARLRDRAAVRARPAARTAGPERADGVHRADGARAPLAAAVAGDLSGQGSDGGRLGEACRRRRPRPARRSRSGSSFGTARSWVCS